MSDLRLDKTLGANPAQEVPDSKAQGIDKPTPQGDEPKQTTDRHEPNLQLVDQPRGGGTYGENGSSAPEASLRKSLAQQVNATHSKNRAASPIASISLATEEDLQAIAELQRHYSYKNVAERGALKDGWLAQIPSPYELKHGAEFLKHHWVAKNDSGEIIGYLTMSEPTQIQVPVESHRIFSHRRKSVERLLQSGDFIYSSQIAIHPDCLEQGVASDLQRRVFRMYQDVPVVTHVAVFTQKDLAQAGGALENLQPESLNRASHAYHQRRWVPIAQHANVDHPAVNTGLEPPAPDSDVPALCALMYLFDPNRRSNAERHYEEPMDLIRDNPVTPESLNDWKMYRPPMRRIEAELRNPMGSGFLGMGMLRRDADLDQRDNRSRHLRQPIEPGKLIYER